MKRFFTASSVLFFCIHLFSQTANDNVPVNNEVFRWGTNPGWGTGWSNLELADLAAGNKSTGIPGAGCNTLRVSLPHSHLETFGYDISLSNYIYYDSLGLKSLTAFLGGVDEDMRSTDFFCLKQSRMWKNMYTPIWDNGENGTPVNDENYFALYVYKTVLEYGDYVKFWEIINEPDFSYSSHGWELPSDPDSWYNVDPNPCDLANLYAPVEYYIRALRISYEVIKSLEPDDYVCLGGIGYSSFLDVLLRNTDEPIDGDVTEEYPYYAGAYFDCISFHKYPMYALSEWDDDIEGWKYYRHSDAALNAVEETIDGFQNILDEYGYDGVTYPKKVQIITEVNLPRKAFKDYIGSDQAQYNFLSKLYFKAQEKELQQVHTYTLWDNPSSFENYSVMGYYEYLKGVNYGNQVEHSAATANRTWSTLLNGYSFSKAYTNALNLPKEIDGVVFKKNDSLRIALWAKTKYDMSEWASGNYFIPSFTGESTAIKRYEWNFTKTNSVADLPLDVVSLGATPSIFEFPDSDSTISVQIEESCFFNGVVDDTKTGAARNEYIALDQNMGASFTIFIHAKQAKQERISFRYQNEDVSPFVCQLMVNGTLVSNDVNFPATTGNTWEEVAVDITLAEGQNGITITSLTDNSSIVFDEIITSFNVYFGGCETAVQTGTNANNTIPGYEGLFSLGTPLEKNAHWTNEQYVDLIGGNVQEGIVGIGAQALQIALSHAEFEQSGYSSKKALFDYSTQKDIHTFIGKLGDAAPSQRSTDTHCAGNSLLWENMYTPIWDAGEAGTPINDTNYLALYIYKTILEYGDKVAVWEMFPEPDKTSDDFNDKPEWLTNDPDACELNNLKAPIENYIRALRIAYEVIKYKDSTDIVCLGALSKPSFLDALLRNTDEPGSGNITSKYPYKGGAYFDCFSFQAYPGITNTAINNSDDAVAATVLLENEYDSVLARYGYNGSLYPEKLRYVAKTGVQRTVIDAYFGSDQYQYNYLTKLYLKAPQYNVKHVFAHSIVDNADESVATNPLDLMGFYLDNSTSSFGEQIPANASIATRTVDILLRGYEYSAFLTSSLNLPDKIDGVVYQKNDSLIIALWATTNNAEQETVSGSYELPHLFNTESDIIRYEWDYSETNNTSIQATSSITLSASVSFFAINDEITPQTSIVECEDASSFNAEFFSIYRGFTGSGYMDVTDYLVGFISLDLYSETAGKKSVLIRYANASADTRACEIVVNGETVVPFVAFPITESWIDWQEVYVETYLKQGLNTFKIKAVTTSGAPNFDHLKISGNVYSYKVGTQSIYLNKGWNLKSLYLQPDNASIQSVFPNADTVKTLDSYFVKSYPSSLNKLTQIEEDKAYLIYNTKNESVSINGVNTKKEMSDLVDGWNLVGVPDNYNFIIYKLPKDLKIIKHFDMFYQRNNRFGSLSELEPGKGYFIYK